jgi:hypothetical protein
MSNVNAESQMTPTASTDLSEAQSAKAAAPIVTSNESLSIKQDSS